MFLMLTALPSAWAQRVVLYKANGTVVKYNVAELDSLVFEEKEPPVEGEHNWVDLGLPSGTLWATCNVGSDNPEVYGDYFAWGETEPKNYYDTSNYKWNRGSGMMTKYCTVGGFGAGGMTDDLIELLPADDAATANWGSDWQMPSREQAEELTDTFFTTSKWTSLNDFYGTKITSKRNGNWIFLPASGFANGTSISRRDNFGSFWTRSLRVDAPRDAYDFAHTWSGTMWGTDRRYMGENVRPVRVERMPRVLVSKITLSESTLHLLSGETKSITATVLPLDAFLRDVSWESSNEEVAQVSPDGLVTAYWEGTCTITCRTHDGSGVYAECTVTVEVPEPEPIDSNP